MREFIMINRTSNNQFSLHFTMIFLIYGLYIFLLLHNTFIIFSLAQNNTLTYSIAL